MGGGKEGYTESSKKDEESRKGKVIEIFEN